MGEQLHTLTAAIRRLARRGAVPTLKRTMKKARAEDIAAAITHLAPAEKRLVFQQVDSEEVAAEVLVALTDADFDVLARAMPFQRLVAALDHMEVDDEADAVARLPDDLREKVLGAIEEQDKAHLEEILAWPDDSAGGIMQPIAFRLNEQLTCRDAINALHEDNEGLEMVFYLYVENEQDQLVGVTSLRALLTHPPSTQLKDVMTSDIITASPETDQEEVARIVSRYDLLALPVVDQSRRLLGIVTIDDVVDVIKEEAAEDMMLMAGVGDDLAPHQAGTFSSARQRLPWLLVTLFGGIGMAEVIGIFEVTLSKEFILAGFIPVIMGMGGNVGIQAATIAVRNIAIGQVGTRGAWATIFREAQVGLVLGTAFAIMLGGYVAVRHGELTIGIAIALSIVTEIIAATAVGSAIPLVMNKVGADPAVATGPFVTTFIDLIALVIYFVTCSTLLGL